jgi:hypothetical protein
LGHSFFSKTGKYPTIILEIAPSQDHMDKKKLARCATNTAKHLGSDGQAFGFILDVSVLAVALAAGRGMCLFPDFVMLRKVRLLMPPAFTQRLGPTSCM